MFCYILENNKTNDIQIQDGERHAGCSKLSHFWTYHWHGKSMERFILKYKKNNIYLPIISLHEPMRTVQYIYLNTENTKKIDLPIIEFRKSIKKTFL